jgi:hypothetical protein
MFLLNSKDRTPVGIDAAKNSGSDLMEKIGDTKVPEPDSKGAEVAEDLEDDSEDDEFDAKDLF